MLYDPKWEAPAIDIYSQKSLLQSLIFWLERQDPRTTYSWCGHCLLEQWSEFVGLRDGLYSQDPDIYARVVRGNSLAASGEHTFGAALDRARAALSRA